MTNAVFHQPVLLRRVLESLAPSSGELYIDCTVGGGGHALGILEGCAPEGRLLGLEADAAVLELARARFERAGYREGEGKRQIAKGKLQNFDGGRWVLVDANFRRLWEVAREHGFLGAHGVLFDLGLCSWHLEESGRGFSFAREEPLDMRFDATGGPSAADLLNEESAATLADIFRRYGELPPGQATRLARAIEATRRRAPLRTTGQLVELVRVARVWGRPGAHPATRVFQALRIAVNDELRALEEALPQAVEVLAPGGRLAVISFHSLEDRIVKQFVRGSPLLRPVNKKPIGADSAELQANPRARSAKLRVAERT